jgi:hypothetical protein
MKPMPAKPRIIIAHVEGSGTAENRNRSQIAKLEIVESNRSPDFEIRTEWMPALLIVRAS